MASARKIYDKEGLCIFLRVLFHLSQLSIALDPGRPRDGEVVHFGGFSLDRAELMRTMLPRTQLNDNVRATLMHYIAYYFLASHICAGDKRPDLALPLSRERDVDRQVLCEHALLCATDAIRPV